MHVKRFWALLALLALSGCVAPAPHPFVSPLELTFTSPLPAAHLVYLPLYTHPIHKRGISLACGYEDMARLERETQALGVSWLWNWQTDPPVFEGIESVPCVWGAAYIGKPLGGNSEWVIGFNEPEQRDQANMTPAAAALTWRDLEDAYPDRKLTSPQVVQPDARWLEEWYAAYVVYYGQAPRLDALAIHTYIGNDIEDYKRQVLYYIDLAKKWGVPEVWITEWTFAPMLDGTVRNSAQAITDYVAWLDAQPMVTRYSPWTNRVECMQNIAPDDFFDTPLFATNGLLTTAGQAYQRRDTW
jgi:hypothetical protein